jgi:hypothetical protein
MIFPKMSSRNRYCFEVKNVTLHLNVELNIRSDTYPASGLNRISGKIIIRCIPTTGNWFTNLR